MDIRTLTEDAAESYLRCVRTSFLHPARGDADATRFWLSMKPDLTRTWAAFDGPTVVGTLRSLPFELTVPGGRTLAAAGITMVTVAPTHRRRGLLTGLMGTELAATAERGDPVAILIASEWRIYGRFGYGPATEGAEWTVDGRRAAAPAPLGRLEQVSAEQLLPLAPAAYDRARLLRAGGLSRPPVRYERDFGLIHPENQPPDWDGRAVVHRSPEGEVDGWLRWHIEENRTEAVLWVDELVAATPPAYADLWRFALSVDLIDRVVAAGRPVDEALPWLIADGRAAKQTRRYDEVWLRVLDVPAALTARSYSAPGRLVLEVLDDAGYAAGTWALDAGPDGSTCTRTGAAADLTLPVTALGSAYLGGHRLATLAVAGLVAEHRPGALAEADRLFATDRPPHATLHF